jgi:hypothetical protein
MQVDFCRNFDKTLTLPGLFFGLFGVFIGVSFVFFGLWFFVSFLGFGLAVAA